MSTNSSQNPPYRIPRLRQCNGRGFVELNGKRIYLGPWGSPLTEEAYARTIAEWSANRHRILRGPEEIVIDEVIDVYLGHCEEYYRRPDGTPTSHICRIETAVRSLRRLYGSTLARDPFDTSLTCWLRKATVVLQLSRPKHASQGDQDRGRLPLHSSGHYPKASARSYKIP